MQTIADFKRRVTVGAKLYTELYWTSRTTGQFELKNIWDERPVSIVQSNSFAFTTRIEPENKFTDSWSEWPKKSEFTVVDANTVQIIKVDDQGAPWCKLIYKFLQGD